MKIRHFIRLALAGALCCSMMIGAAAQTAAPASAAASSLTAESWALGRLPDYGQELFTSFRSQMREYTYQPTAKLACTVEQAGGIFDELITLLRKQCPELFWLGYGNHHYSIQHSSMVMTYTPSYESAYLSGGGLNTALIQSTQAQIDQVVAQIGVGETTYETVKQFNAWLAGQVRYSYEFGNSHSYEITGPFLQKKSLCEGYAKAFKYLCDRAGIDCVMVSGKGIMNGVVYDHAWDYVKMDDGQWYLVDPTWNALNVGAAKERWFLLGSGAVVNNMTLLTSHAPGRADYYPTLAVENYTPAA